ncbi:MAG TPA: ABC transporter ATP-binding protein [Anaerolineales bacterium]|nr:ABC transporter ATP-binding protein [Anaerolineales bacterium]
MAAILQPELTKPRGGIESAPSPSVRLVDLSKRFVEGQHVREVLRGVNAIFWPGEFVAIRGRSGSGKSTLLNLIADLDEPSSGQVFVAGVCLSALPARGKTAFRRDNIGFVFQFFNLIPTLTVLENVVLPAEIAGLQRAQARQAAQQLLGRVGLSDRGEDFPDRLSGGEQQRVAIARALIRRPPLVLADEPTGNLDRSTGEQVLALLAELSRDAGGTLLMATHSHRIAEQADRVLAIEDGNLMEASSDHRSTPFDQSPIPNP